MLILLKHLSRKIKETDNFSFAFVFIFTGPLDSPIIGKGGATGR